MYDDMVHTQWINKSNKQTTIRTREEKNEPKIERRKKTHELCDKRHIRNIIL